MSKPNWTELTLTDGEREYPATQRITDLRELRDTGIMRRMWACSLEELSAHAQAGQDGPPGLQRDEIDFSGLEYFTGESQIVRYRVVVSEPGHHERVLEVEEGGVEAARALLYAQLPDGGTGRIEYKAHAMNWWETLE